MNVAWDYTALANSYDKRADYCPRSLDRLSAEAGVEAGSSVAALGPGPGNSPFPSPGAGSASQRSSRMPPCAPSGCATRGACQSCGARARAKRPGLSRARSIS